MSNINIVWNWTQFCEQDDDLIIWDPRHNDFGRCFEVVCLQFPLLALLAITSAYYCGKQMDWVVRTSFESNVLKIRYLTCLLLSMVPVVSTWYQVSSGSKPLVPVQYFFSSVQCLTWLTHFIYVLALRHRLGPGLRGPTIVCLLWFVNFVCSCVMYRSTYRVSGMIADGQMEVTFDTVSLILQCVYGLTLLPGGHYDQRSSTYHTLNVQTAASPAMISSTYSGFREDLDPGYLGVAGGEEWGVLPRLCFSWVGPLMSKGVAGGLRSADDLHDLPVSLTSTHASQLLERALAQSRLLVALHRCFWKEFYGIGLLKFISDVSGFFGPLLLNKLVTFIETKSENVQDGYIYAACLCAITLIGAFCNSHFSYLMAKVGLKIRASLVCIVYKKTLTLSTITLSNFSTGEINNFMSTDTDRIVNSCGSFHACWSIPFQIAVTLYLLYQQVGNAFLAGVVFAIVLIPINKCIASQIGKLSTKMMEQKDNRVKIMLGILRGIKTIKLHVWEDHFFDKISDIRSRELRYLKGRKYLDALCVYFWATTPVVISILTFASYTLMGNRLTAATVFTSIALLNMLISPLNAFPWVLNGLTEAWVSLKRIQRLLEIDDLDMGEYYSPLPSLEPTDGAIVVKDGNFCWGPGKFELHNINFIAPKGQFIGVFGTVGCGKSSLLAALLAEMDKTSGLVGIPNLKHGFGFVSQTPWLQRASIRDNILFGKPYDQTKYRAVLEACALTQDLMVLPSGDLTTVAEGGSTLSGGQRTRVALARAVYQERNVYLLDDVFSAVDARVAKHLLRHCINGLLRDKTRVVCTHQTQYLLQADTVVSIEQGTVLQGPPAEVLPDYEEMVTSHQLEGEGETQREERPPSPILSTEGEVDSLQGEEGRETGTVAWRVYNTYLAAVGYCLTAAILISLTLMQVSRNGTDWWMAYWVTSENTTAFALPFNLDLTKSDLLPWVDPSTRYYLTVYVLIAVCNSVFTLFRAFLFAYGGIHAASAVHKVLLNKVIRAKIVNFDILPVGQILNRFSSDMYTVDDSLPFISNILLAQFFGVIGSMFVMLYGVPELFFILVPLVPIYHWLQRHYRLTSRELKRLSSTTLSPLYNHFNETLQGLLTIRAFRAVPRFRRDNGTRLEANQKAQLASQAAAQWLSLRLQLIGVAMVTGVGLLATLQHHLSIANPGLVGLAISYALSVTGALNGLVNAFTETEREMVSVERVDQYLREITTEDFRERLAPPPFWLSQGVVSFDNVTLKYRDHLLPSLKSVSFCTRPAERVGVVGRTGAGKSSLFAALFRLVELHDGEISIDSVNIAHIGLMQLRSRMSVIPQEPTLFPGTVRDNIDPLRQYSDSNIWSAIQRCHLVGVIRDLDTTVELSTGQAQLLCLCRAVLHNAKILCVDEATANVDEETDKLITQTLRSNFRQSTVITIAHRVRTIIDSDRVLVMGEGTVLEFDTPEQLFQDRTSHLYQLLHQDYDS
ncbi:ATP-binding cassette sub-family C member 10 isoform X2 [Macrosteles quadrilineatus]|nr:ATP-binding cassette sub-family C member 10 isoform X2 [Macrosteles quadrilineatus]